MGFGVFIHRADSPYEDSPATQYQFPSQYLSRASDTVGDWIVYYEPRKVRGTRGYYAPEAMVDAWVREKRYFKPGVFPYNSTTGRVEDVGHYTQLVWRATSQVGCAEAASAAEDILVCRYAEAGNYIGERPL